MTALVFVIDPTGDDWTTGFTGWCWWAEAGIALANLISTTVLWTGLVATIWTDVVWAIASDTTVVLWIVSAVNIITSLGSTDSLWATSVILNTFVMLIVSTFSEKGNVAESNLFFKSCAMNNSVADTSAWEARFWHAVPWSFLSFSSVNGPRCSIGNVGTVLVNTVSVWWSSCGNRWWSAWGGSGNRISAWSGSGNRISTWGGGGNRISAWGGSSDRTVWFTDLSTTIIVGGSKSVSLTGGAMNQSTSSGITSTLQSLAAAILGRCLNKTFFEVLTALWFWASDGSTLFWSTNVLVAAVVNLVADEMFVESTLWYWWTVSVEALDVSSFATVANSADIALIIPGFTEKSSTFVVIETSWWLWSGWTGWWSGGSTTDALVSLAAWAWSKLTNVTVFADDFVDVDLWAAGLITTALIGWALTLVLSWSNLEFASETMCLLAHWWAGTLWCGFTSTVDNLSATFVGIGVSVNGFEVVWTSLWIEWSTTFGLSSVNSEIFTTVLGLTLGSGVKDVTDVNLLSLVNAELVIVMWSSGSSTLSGGSAHFAIVNVIATALVLSS